MTGMTGTPGLRDLPRRRAPFRRLTPPSGSPHDGGPREFEMFVMVVSVMFMVFVSVMFEMAEGCAT
jgi:hypothetical protein